MSPVPIQVHIGQTAEQTRTPVTDVCAVCPHPWTFHDRIAARYCTATIAGEFSRGCVCTPYPDGAGSNKLDKDTR